MVEPLTLGTVVAALVARALARAQDKALDEGEGVLRRLVEAVRHRLSNTEVEAGATALAQLEDAPDSPNRVRSLAEALDKDAAALPEFRSQLEALVEEARRTGIDVDAIGQIAVGDQNVQSAGLVDSEVNVSFGGRPGDSEAPRPAD